MQPEATVEVPRAAGKEAGSPAAAGGPKAGPATPATPSVDGEAAMDAVSLAAEGVERTGAAGGAKPGSMDLPALRSLDAAASEASAGNPERNIELLQDVNLRVKVELGRGKMFLRDVLRLSEGSVVELEKLAGDPLDIYVNDRLIGKGEVLVLNENFCVRITQIFSPEESLRIKGIA